MHAISVCYVRRWTSSWTRTGTCLGLTYWICYREARQRYIYVHSCRTELIAGGRLVISHTDSIIIIGDNHWRMIRWLALSFPSILPPPSSSQLCSPVRSLEAPPPLLPHPLGRRLPLWLPSSQCLLVSSLQPCPSERKANYTRFLLWKLYITINLLSLGAILTLWDASSQILKRSACEGQIKQNQHSYHILLRAKYTLPSPHTLAPRCLSRWHGNGAASIFWDAGDHSYQEGRIPH